jgi:propanediol dehydratase small subunit
MIDNSVLEQMVKEVMASMAEKESYTAPSKPAVGGVTEANYPLSEKMADVIESPTGKKISEITIEAVMRGDVTSDDVKIAPETLEMQAQVAESVGRDAFARNLRRAAELIAVPDDRVLEIYNALRPYRSTKAELLAIADELENKYKCTINGAFVREAATLYEERGRLKK